MPNLTPTTATALIGPDWEKHLAEMERLYADTTEGEWAFKSVGEKCYATILGASPYYLSGPKARSRKEIEPLISSRGEVSDEFDEGKDEFNEVDFTDRIAESDEQRGGIDFGFAAVMHNRFPDLAAAIRALHAELATLREQLAAAREDSARQAYLRGLINCSFWLNGNGEITFSPDEDDLQKVTTGRTLDDAIDAARAEVKQP